MDQFLANDKLAKLTRDEIENLNGPLTIKEVIKNIPGKKYLGPRGKVYQTFKEEITSIP